MKLEGQVAIVTGASRGLGRAVAIAYGKEGAKVVVTYRASSPTGLLGTAEETCKTIQNGGGEAVAISCDSTDDLQVRDMTNQVIKRFGKVDYLVNNAGIMIPGEPFLDIDPVRWDNLMATNITGSYLACRHVLPHMIEKGQGHVINIGSGAAINHRAGGSAYCSSKAALHLMSLCLAEEMEEHNIRINVLDPGPLKSEGSSVIPWTKHDWHLRLAPEEAAPSVVGLALQTFTGRVLTTEEYGKTWGQEN